VPAENDECGAFQAPEQNLGQTRQEQHYSVGWPGHFGMTALILLTTLYFWLLKLLSKVARVWKMAWKQDYTTANGLATGYIPQLAFKNPQNRGTQSLMILGGRRL
jgi:hypothetical protein